MQLIDILSWAFLGTGSFLCVAGALGLLRLPDFYTRLHAGGVIDTGGASLILVGLMLQAGLSLIAVKLPVHPDLSADHQPDGDPRDRARRRVTRSGATVARTGR